MRIFGKVRDLELPFSGLKGSNPDDTVCILVLDHAHVTSLENGEPPVRGESVNILLSKDPPEDRDGTDERTG